MKLSKDRLTPIRELWTKKSANTLESHLNFWTSQIGVNSRPEDRIRGVTWNAQKRMWKRNLSCDGICIFFEMPQNRTCSFSIHFLFSKSNGNWSFSNQTRTENFRISDSNKWGPLNFPKSRTGLGQFVLEPDGPLVPCQSGSIQFFINSFQFLEFHPLRNLDTLI